jgi:hypothetical protein
MSPPDFWRYLKELAEGLAAAGDDAEAAKSLRETLRGIRYRSRRTATAGYQLKGRLSLSNLYSLQYV